MNYTPKNSIPVQFLQTHFFPQIFPEARSFASGGDKLRGITQEPIRETCLFQPFGPPETTEPISINFGSDTLQGLVTALADESSKLWHEEKAKRGGLSKAVRSVIGKYEWPPDIKEKLVSLVCSELGARGNRKRHAWPKS